MTGSTERPTRHDSWLRQPGIVAVSVLLGVFAFLTAILFVSHSPWMAIGATAGSAVFGYAAYRFFLPPQDEKKIWIMVVSWTITTTLAMLLLSAEKWWRVS